MATSGSLTTSAYSNRSITFSWQQSSQSIANNTTTISWTLKGSGSASGYYLTQNITLKLDGKVVYEHLKSKDGQIQLYNGTSIASGTYTFTHSSDGSKSFTAYVEAGIYVWEPNCSGTKTFTLDSIPRQATITSAPDFNDEGSPVLKYSNPAGSAVSSLQACIADTSGNVIISYRDISKTGTSYTFSFTDAERNTLRSKCSNANSMSVRFYLKTVIGGNTFTPYTTKTLSIINATPTLSPTIVDTDTYTTALTGDSSKLIKYFSDAKITIGAAALKNATVSSKSCVNNGTTKTADGTFSNITSNSFKFSVQDSRGNTATKTLTPTMVNYVKLTCNIKSLSVSTDGVMSFTLNGNYFNGSFGSKSNSLTVQYRYKVNGGSYGSWTSITATKSENTYTASGTISGLNYQATYVFQARAADAIYDGTNQSRVSTTEKPISAKPIFDWDADDFAINVNLVFNGNGVNGALYGLYGLTSIPSSSNLNDYKTPGIYAIRDNTTAGTLTNSPCKRAGRLIVYTATGSAAITGNWIYINQEYHPMYADEPTYRRLLQTDGTGTWSYSPWYASATPTKVS